MPDKVINFVGREEELKNCSEILDLENDATFLIITGGPCFGKSSLAVKVGYEMYEKVYNYVVWINMRDITMKPSDKFLEDIASNILQKFNIYTPQMQEDILGCLRRKLAMIVEDSKSALLIFDNADDLIEPEEDESCQSSAYERLCQLIRDTKGNFIRCIFTSRVYKSCLDVGKHKMELGCLSPDHTRLFLNTELKDLQDKDNLIEEFVAISQGLPYALRLMCSEVVTMDDQEMIKRYVSDLKKSLVDTLDENSRMKYLFNLSCKRLNENERSLFISLAIFPSAFTYLYLSKVLSNLENSSINPRILNTLEKHSLISSYSGHYLIHPFLREFVKDKYWNTETRQKYEEAYYKAYINQLFELAKKSLEKDKFVDCLKDFCSEQQNFFHVMREIGKKFENSPPHIGQMVKEELLKYETPEYIYVVLFLCHEVYDLRSVVLIEFFAGCETFVEGQKRKNIWCCRFDVNMTIYEKKINDDFQTIKEDDFGEILVAKRRWNQAADGEDFQDTVSCLDRYMKKVEELGDCKIKAYFTDSLLKTKVRLLKKTCSWSDPPDEKLLIYYLKKALDKCESTFGEHWLTVDCHTQLGKLHWAQNNREAAILSFNSAVHLADRLSVTGNRRYLSCLVDKGRFLAQSGEKESIEEGKRLIDEALESCKDFPDEIMWLLAMKTLVKVDKTKREEMVKIFLEQERCNHRWLQVMRNVIVAELDSHDEDVNAENFICLEKEKVKRLREVIEHLKYLCKSSEQEDKSFWRTAITQLYFCTMLVGTRCMHALSEGDAKGIASKALEIMKNNDCIAKDKDKEEELFLIVNSDKDQYELLARKCRIVQLMCRIPGINQEEEINTLLSDCKQYEDLSSRIFKEFDRNNKEVKRK